MPPLQIHRRSLQISFAVGLVSAVLTFFSFAFAHGSPIVGAIVFGFLMPALFAGELLGLDGALTFSTYAFVFIVQCAVAYLLCLFVRLIKSDVDRTKSTVTDA